MKKDIHIDPLFQKAANTPVHTSFDEAKENFSASLAQRNARKWRILRSKNWIIMITLITSAIVAGIFVLGSNTDISNTAGNSNDIRKTMDNQSTQTEKQKRELHAENKPSQDQLEVMHPSLIDSFVPMSPISHDLFLFESNNHPIEKVNGQPYIFDFASDRRVEKKDSVEIPTLTEDEIADNEKVKKKMMKMLAKLHKDHYAYVPSGSAKYKGEAYSIQAFYMQVNEVSNLQYRTFLNDLLIQGRNEEYQEAYPQEYQWSEQLEGFMDAMNDMYFTHPAYDEYPVVNVTREGAEMYCKWLTLETANSKYVEDVLSLNDLRLPQRLEWTYAASSGESHNVYPWDGPTTQNEKDCYLANYNPDTTNLNADGAFLTAKTGTYLPNEFGIYNLSGNVAEMVYGPTDFTSKTDLVSIRDEPGTAGGGWIDNAEDLKVEADDPYEGITEGHPNIGFRVVMTHLGVKK